ncbi:hypothetical protein VB780_18930 [Leptolyngbya sp. CCNP1308]|uniref:IS1096 element passenger TnpR family protein n=1 Tax=Leptolyngbya sp. CCNP1308 TaxID=3110255 RepID=UPI002B1F092B|nr:hypothetical protein [Leptolyngbya sp. CCNP1308]MEA5450661.1 hypothetical protein [Leptolyngbya sp. CCNP1308]
MVFNLRQLDNLNDDDVEPLLLSSTEFRPERHIFKVSLGKAWRRVAVVGEATLDDLSGLILESIEFDDHDYLHKFTFKTSAGRVMEVTHPYAYGDLSTDEVKVGSLPLQVGDTIDYLPDLGDCWEIQLVLDGIEPETSKGFQKTKIAKRKKPKVLGEILEAYGEAPEQYPDED